MNRKTHQPESAPAPAPAATPAPQAEAIPAGYWRDARGVLTPDSLVEPIDKARDALVRELIERARLASQVLSDFKASAFGEIADFVEHSAAQYGAKLGGKKGNVTLITYDGRYKIQRQIQETLSFDERLQAAKSLIDECISRWSEGSRDEIKVLVNDAFQVNKEGQISTGRVLSLRKLAIKDEGWVAAMKAIGDSVQTAGSAAYVRFYERIGDSDQYRAISLDLATV